MYFIKIHFSLIYTILEVLNIYQNIDLNIPHKKRKPFKLIIKKIYMYGILNTKG